MSKSWPAYLVGLAMAAGPGGAAAQAPPTSVTQPSNAVENVVVTAQKRSQKTQDIPITITVLDAKRLASGSNVQEQRRARRVRARRARFRDAVRSSGNQPLINIRGVGLNDTNTNNCRPQRRVCGRGVSRPRPPARRSRHSISRAWKCSRARRARFTGATVRAVRSTTSPPSRPTHFYASEDRAVRIVQYGVVTHTVAERAASPPASMAALAVCPTTYSDGYFSDLTRPARRRTAPTISRIAAQTQGGGERPTI